jgi:hypothetical protein
MPRKDKGRSGGDRPTQKTTDSRNHTGADPLIGWFNLAKPLRNRQQKRGWKRGNQRGRMDATLAALLALLAAICIFFAWGVTR